MGAVAELKFRRGAILEQHLDGRRRRRPLVPRGAHAGAVARRRADRAAGLSVERRSRAAAGSGPGAGADLRVDQRSRASRRGAADQALAREEDRQARRAAAADRQAGRSAGERRSGLGGVHARLLREPVVDAGARVAGEPGQHSRQLAAAGHAVRKGAVGQRQREAAVGAGARAPAGRGGRLRREARTQRTRGGVLPPCAEHPARGRLRAGGAGAALHPHRALERSGRHAAQEGAAGHRRRGARRDPDPHRHRLGGDAGERRAGDRRLERRSAGQPLERAGAARARSPLPDARRVPRAGRQPPAPADAGRGRRRRDGDAARSARRAARAEARSAGRRGRHLLEDPQARTGAPRDDRGPGANPPRRGARARCGPAARADLQDPRRLDPPHRRLRGRGPTRHRSGAEDRSLSPDRRRLRGRPRRSGARLRGAGPRAGRGSAAPRGADRRRTAGARARQAGRSGRSLRAARHRRLRSGAQERALSQDRAPLRGRPGRRSAGGGRVRRRAGGLAAGSRGGQRARAALPARRRLREPGAAAPAQGGDRRRRRRKEGALLPRGAALRRGPRGSRELGEGVPARSLRRRRRQRGARSAGAALHPPRALERSEEHLRQEGGAGVDAGRQEADAVRARPGLRPRARRSGARGRDLQLDHRSRSGGLRRRPGARSPLSAAGTLVRPPGGPRAADRDGPLARGGGVAPLPHRRAVARASEGSGARRGGVPPGADHGPRARADGARAGSAHVGRRGGVGRAGGAGAGADLRERRRVGPGHRRLRGDAVSGGGARAQGGAARPDGGDRGAAPLAPERGVRHLRARAARRSDQPGHAVPARSAGGRDGALGQAGHPVRDRAGQGRRSAQADRSPPAPRARLRRGDQPARGGHRHLPQGGRGGRREQAGPGRARSSLRPRPAVGRAGGDRAPRGRHRLLRRPAGRADLPAGADLRARA